MNEKTNSFLPWTLVLLSVTLLIMVVFLLSDFLNRVVNTELQNVLFTLVASPGFELVRYTTLEAIRQFGGSDMSTLETLRSLIASAAGLSLLMIIAPYWLVKGYRRLEQNELSGRGFTWYAGAVVLLLGITIPAYHVVQFTQSSPEIDQAIESSRVMDELRTQMTSLAYDASERMILPPEQGGGGGSFLALPGPDGETRPLTLEELPSYNDSGRFHIYVNDEVTDSTLQFTGTPDLPGDTPRRFIDITVTPHEENLFRMNSREM
jgi:hypothetical protein